MASVLRLGLGLFVLLHAFFWLPNSVLADTDDEDTLLQGLNSYRQAQKLPALIKNGKADCLADQIAADMEDRPCTSYSAGATTAAPVQTAQLTNYPKHLKKCKINADSTVDGVVMPVCVHKLVPTLVLTNYTHTSYAKYLNDSKFTGAGLGSEDDWMVLVLGTAAPTGSFTGAAVPWVSHVSIVGYLVSLLLSTLLIYG